MKYWLNLISEQTRLPTSDRDICTLVIRIRRRLVSNYDRVIQRRDYHTSVSDFRTDLDTTSEVPWVPNIMWRFVWKVFEWWRVDYPCHSDTSARSLLSWFLFVTCANVQRSKRVRKHRTDWVNTVDDESNEEFFVVSLLTVFSIADVMFK